MENQEAISVLESINAKTDYFLINDDARAEAIDMAISALEKQMPRKPINEPIDQPLHYKLCPECQRKISGMEWGQAYCWKCGQAIDWDEGE